jgi:hypothetical protein
VIINAVGGLPHHPRVLKNATYFSTRSARTQEVVSRLKGGGDAHLCRLMPDCVAAISNYISRTGIRDLVDEKNLKMFEIIGDGYVAVQVSKHCYMAQPDQLVQQLEELSKKISFPLVFVPIGLAPGHEDDVACRELQRRLGASAYLLRSETVYDILYAISGAKLFMGTSLHGNITAMSYDVPYMGFAVEKLHQYLQTWGGGIAKLGCVDIDMICDAAIKLLEQPSSETIQSNQVQRTLAEENMHNIFEVISDERSC